MEKGVMDRPLQFIETGTGRGGDCQGRLIVQLGREHQVAGKIRLVDDHQPGSIGQCGHDLPIIIITGCGLTRYFSQMG